jgi:predicted GTPase
MFPRLTDDPKFKKDLKKFQHVRDNLPTELSKNTMSSILEDFISCAKNVDTHHTPYPDGTISPGKLRETRQKLVNLRMQLEKFERDFKAS